MRVIKMLTPVSLGGGEVQTLIASREFGKRGVDIKVVNLTLSEDFEKELKRNGIDFITVSNIKLGFSPPQREYLKLSFKLVPHVIFNKYLVRFLKAADLIHVMGFPANMCFFLLRRIHRINRVAIYSHHSVKSPMKGPMRDIYERILEDFDAIVGVSSRTTQSLIEVFPKLRIKIKTIPNGVVTERFDIKMDKVELRKFLKLPERDILGIYVARFSPLKNHMFLIDLLKAIRQQEFKLVLLGEGSERERFLNTIASEGLSSRIAYCGFIKPDLVPYYLNACDIYLHPSRVEGFSIAILEAVAAGLPCIIFDDICSEEIRKFVLVAKNGQEFIDHTKKLITNDNLRENLSRACRRYSSELDISKTVEKWIELYRDLLRDRGEALTR